LLALVVDKTIPEQERQVEAGFLRAFDWGGVALLAPGMACLIFFLSSRPITGVEPLQDWRLLVAGLLFLAAFFAWEKRRASPFIPLGLFARSAFMRGSFCASMRMVAMGGIGFLVPLYLVDIQQIKPTELGSMLMIGAGAMTLVVRVAGALADSWSSRWLVVLGLLLQIATMLAFWKLPGDASLWSIGLALGGHGLGAGIMLATLHKVVINDVGEQDIGAAAGLYGMFRFLGATVGTALSGVLLQNYLDQGMPLVEAYQQVFFAIAAFPLLGLLVAFSLRDGGKRNKCNGKALRD
jgi:predicted MFS family arabinose efflux permease